MKPLCFSVVTSKLSLRIGERLLHELSEQSIPGEIIGLVHADNVDHVPVCTVHAAMVATGGTEHLLIKIAEKTKLLYILYTDMYNSLAATIETLAYLRKHGFKTLSRRIEDIKSVTNQLVRLEKAVKAYYMVRDGKFGVVGGISPWLVYSKVEANYTKKRGFGDLIYISNEELYKAIEETNVEKEIAESILKKAVEVHLQNPVQEVLKALKVYKALKRIIERYHLTGLTLKCFDLIRDIGTTGCIAVSLLNSELIPAACEGDVPLLYTIAIGTGVSGKPVFMGNVVDIEDSALVLAHCTSWLTDNYTLYTHFESNIGVSIRVDYPLGLRVTVFRIDPELTKMRIGVGEVVEHSWKPYMCRTQVKLKISNPYKIIEDSIGNHYAMLLGDYTEELQVVSMLLDLNAELM